MEQPAFLKEIEKSRVDEERDGNDQASRRRYTFHSFLDRKSSRNASNIISIGNVTYQSVDHSYVQMKDSPQLSSHKTVKYARSLSLDSDKLPPGKDDTDAGVPELIMKEGWLHRTSQLKNSKTKGRNRQYRKFKLTPRSLEYNHFLQKVKVQKQYPLTSIVDVAYDETESPVKFKLELQKIEVILEARNQTNCKQWVEAIRKAWKLWKQFNLAEKDVTSVDEIIKNETRPEQKEYLKKNKDYLEQAKKNLGYTTPGLVTTPKVAEKCFSSALQQSKGKTPNTDEQSVESATHPKHSGLQRFLARIGLTPRIQKSIDQWKSHEVGDDKNDFVLMNNKHSFVMIKYPRRKGYSLPHERVFKMDFENLLIMWHQTEDSTFNYLRTLKTENIVDVRNGQESDGFYRFPYEEMEKQSLSILVEGEKQTVPGGRCYAVLQSLDLICDTKEEQNLWYRVLKQFISPKYRLYSSCYESIDPTIIWLVTHWSTLNKGEIREDTALSFGSSHVPQIKRHKMEKLLTIAHECQLKEAEHHGHSLHWEGFILFFILLCEIDKSSCWLLNIFESYAKTYPSLGMTVEEFQKFLTESQHWSSKDATNEKCVQLMVHYDYHYRAYKMHKADSSPFELNLSLCLLSFGGFLSFLRSPDNSVINREHEESYQDMTQPLSHYFINSSHNTYLEGHQLIGRSTTDAYVRALLQGCRCLELDCWDGPDGQPRITHGNTPVSDLSLEEVAKTIDKYAFNVSIYPLILSLENHCSPDQQAEMVKIFKKEFGQKLLTMEENPLKKVKGFDRLPSPQQLQRKIILKGTDVHSSSKTPQRTLLNRITRRNPKPKSTKRKATRVNVSSSIKSPFQFPSRYHPQSNETAPEEDKIQEVDDDNEDIIESDLTKDLSDLIVYCRTKRIKPWDWDEQKATTMRNMFSFNDHSATTNCADSTEMLACTERQFVRTYPHGTRIDSSNYDPIPLWNHGIHMVALNVQTPDTFMFLNQGKFRQNGGCGYVLKPEVMRNPDGTDYKPNMEEPLEEVTPVNLTITPLSGQHFIVPSKRTVSMDIQYETYGIEHDCEKKKCTANSNMTNPLWPQFKDASKLEKTIYMPELCLVLFAVNIRVSRKLQAGTKLIMLGQNVFPLTSLKPGLRYIPLRTPGGESTSHIGIFVEIKMSKLSHQQASSSGLWSLKELKSPIKRFSSPRLLETYRFGEGETTADTLVDEENIMHSKETTVSTSSLSNGSTDANRTRNQPRMIRQGAISQCTAEIHPY